eukprot:1157528-Pelagomonas_calceolata.AAC.7
MAEIMCLTNHWDLKSSKTIQFGAVGGKERRLGGQRVGFTPWLIWRVRPNPEQFPARASAIASNVAAAAAAAAVSEQDYQAALDWVHSGRLDAQQVDASRIALWGVSYSGADLWWGIG